MPQHLLVAAALVASSAAPALADRPAADALYTKANASQDPHDATACATAYTDLYNADPKSADNDTILWQAAECWKIAGSIGAAIQTLDLVQKYYPNSKESAYAERELGTLYERAGRHADAADHLEGFARRYAGEKDAQDRLAHAIELRIAFGQRDKAIADVDQYAKTWVRRTADIARAQLSIASLYTGDALVKHYRAILAGKPDVDTQIVVTEKLGEELWSRACPLRAQPDGLCTKVVRERGAITFPTAAVAYKHDHAKRPQVCDASRPVIAVVARDARQAAAAHTALEAALKLFDPTTNPSPEVRHAIARARVVLADADLEASIGLGFPTKLDFGGKAKEASMRRFNTFIGARTKAGTAAEQAYTRVLETKDPTASIDAIERMGLLSVAFANTLAGAEIPADVRAGEFADDKIDAYCDQMLTVAGPLEKRATETFSICTTKSAELGVSTDTTRACFGELAQLAPDAGPAIAAFGALPPVAHPRVIETEGPPPIGAGGPAFAALVQDYRTADAHGLRAPACKALAGKFVAAAKAPVVAEAFYMAGLVDHHCGLAAEAKANYDLALKAKPGLAMAMSNLAELAWRAGRVAEAKAGWGAALAVDAKLYAARLDRAAASLDELEAMAANDPKAKQLTSDLEYDLQSAIAVDDKRGGAYAQVAVYTAERGAPSAAYRARAAEAIPAATSSPQARYALAILAMERRAPYRALELLANTDVGELAERSHVLAARIELSLGRGDRAVAAIGAIAAPGPDATVMRGLGLVELGKTSEGIAVLQAAIHADPARADLAFDLGLVFEAKGSAADLAQAAALFGQAQSASNAPPALVAMAKQRAAQVARELERAK